MSVDEDLLVRALVLIAEDIAQELHQPQHDDDLMEDSHGTRQA